MKKVTLFMVLFMVVAVNAGLLSQYVAPEITFNSIITAMDILPANLSATVAGDSNSITAVTFELMTDDLEFPSGAAAVLTEKTMDMQNPVAELMTDLPGIYKVKLTVVDDTGYSVTKVADVEILADPCHAKKVSPSGWIANYFDVNSDCKVDITDFAELALAWLDDTSLIVQESCVKAVTYLPAGE